MTRYQKQRASRNRLRFSEMGKASQKKQADQRMRDVESRRHEQAEIETLNLPRQEGDALGCLQWTDFRTGRVRRWTVRIGGRRDRITLEAPNGRKTASHGWTWVMNHLRSRLV